MGHDYEIRVPIWPRLPPSSTGQDLAGFELVIVDYGAFDSWSDDKSGTENTLTIEFRGKAAKYSGSKTNDLADDFYE